MTNSEMMIALLRRLKVEMNGAVVEAMESRGVHYPLSYGVSLPTIKTICLEYGVNHSLALLLYRQEVRELRLAALYIADPLAVGVGDLSFWASGVVSSEIAEVLAMRVLSRCVDVEGVVRAWVDSDCELLCYAALMTAARSDNGCCDRGWLELLVGRFAESDSLLLRRAAELLGGAGRHSH